MGDQATTHSKHAPVTVRQVFGHPAHLLAFGGGAGLSPVAPGTAGTLVGVVLYWFMQSLPLGQYLAITTVLFIAGVWLCGVTARNLGVHDHAGIVWDEIVGLLITMAAAPRGWLWLFIGFLLFRLFDIWKPWPIRYLDRHVTGGFGVMLDDAVAALYALLIMQILARLFGG
jgi:phosphatidylglycerophosphatase A